MEKSKNVAGNIIAVFLSITIILSGAGCRSARIVSPEQYHNNSPTGIERVVLKDSSVVEFSGRAGRGGVIEDSVIVGCTKEEEKEMRIPIADVRSIEYRYVDMGKTIVSGGGVIAGMAVLLAILMALRPI